MSMNSKHHVLYIISKRYSNVRAVSLRTLSHKEMNVLLVESFYTLQVSNYVFTNMPCVYKSFNRKGNHVVGPNLSIGELCCREHLFSRCGEGM